MNKLNLPPFYIGQKVVYITGHNMPKNSIHVVTGLFKHIECGCWYIAIDNIPVKSTASNGMLYCKMCNSKLKSLFRHDYWQSTSFRPAQQAKFPLITLSKIQEVEKEEILISN